ncbi:Transcriptional repressor SdpR [compost metagenome]
MQDERKGQFILYSLDTTVLEEVMGWFLELTGAGTKSEPGLPAEAVTGKDSQSDKEEK